MQFSLPKFTFNKFNFENKAEDSLNYIKNESVKVYQHR